MHAKHIVSGSATGFRHKKSCYSSGAHTLSKLPPSVCSRSPFGSLIQRARARARAGWLLKHMRNDMSGCLAGVASPSVTRGGEGGQSSGARARHGRTDQASRRVPREMTRARGYANFSLDSRPARAGRPRVIARATRRQIAASLVCKTNLTVGIVDYYCT